MKRNLVATTIVSASLLAVSVPSGADTLISVERCVADTRAKAGELNAATGREPLLRDSQIPAYCECLVPKANDVVRRYSALSEKPTPELKAKAKRELGPVAERCLFSQLRRNAPRWPEVERKQSIENCERSFWRGISAKNRGKVSAKSVNELCECQLLSMERQYSVEEAGRLTADYVADLSAGRIASGTVPAWMEPANQCSLLIELPGVTPK